MEVKSTFPFHSIIKKILTDKRPNFLKKKKNTLKPLEENVFRNLMILEQDRFHFLKKQTTKEYT